MKIQAEDFAVLRTPLFPYKVNSDYKDKLTVNSVFFDEALFISSPSLYEAFHSSKALRSGSIKNAVRKYFKRSAYRCTPFGLFAGVSLALFDDSTNFCLDKIELHERHTDIDLYFLEQVVQFLVERPEVRNHLYYYPNNTIYQSSQQIRYTEYFFSNKIRNYQLVTVDNSRYIQKILKTAEKGARLADLAKQIVSEDVSYNEAKSFVEEMRISQLLISEFELSITELEPLSIIKEKLDRIGLKSSTDLSLKLATLISCLHDLKTSALGEGKNSYKKIDQLVDIFKAQGDRSILCKTDLHKVTKTRSISRNVAEEAKRSITFLAGIRRMKTGRIKSFKDKFIDIYGDKFMPFNEVIDEDMGIGYPVSEKQQADPAPLLKGISLPSQQGEEPQYTIGFWESILLKKFQNAMVNHSDEINLDDININQELALNNLEDSFSATFNVLTKSDGEFDDNDFNLRFVGAHGPSSGNYMARFCRVIPELTQLVRSSIKQEENNYPKDTIFAEVVHLPHARAGNILHRPVLRDYEIPIINPASLPPEKTILLSDLSIGVVQNEIVLYSEKLKCRVVPRQTSAHNYDSNTLPAYHLLCDIQNQKYASGLNWDWGLIGHFDYLPRIRYGKTILARARWTLKSIKGTQFSKDEHLKNVKAQIKGVSPPDAVVMVSSDNEIPLDLSLTNDLEILAEELKARDVILEEDLFEKFGTPINGPEGHFTNECIIPFYKEKEPYPSLIIESKKSNSLHSYLPGSKWLFAKIYCGVKTADTILLNSIKNVSEQLLQGNHIEEFFFIRYMDPDHHLRVRFKGDYHESLDLLNSSILPFMEENYISKFTIDTYKPEYERYDNSNMRNSEKIFFYDSITVLNILNLLKDTQDDLRWLLAIKGVDALLNDLRFRIDDKIKLMKFLSDGFAAEFYANKATHSSLSDKFRTNREQIDSILTNPPEELTPVLNWFDYRSENLVDCVQSIENMGLNKFDLASSYLHMFLNRFLRSKQRLHEMVIYDLLLRTYKSHEAKLRYAGSTKR